jgi:uncharacterized protein involved in exopolysaccharide biosynthesis
MEIDATAMNEQSVDIPITEAIRRIGARWKYLALLFLSGLLLGTALSLVLRPVYVAEVLLATKETESGALGGLARQFSGLASVAGINIGGGNTDRDVARATLTSFETFSEFAAREDVKAELLKNTKLGGSTNPQWRTINALSKRVELVPEKRSGLYRLRLEWYDSETAAKWANDLVALADFRLRRDALKTAESRLAYLEDRMKEPGAVAVNEAVAQVMVDTLRTITMAGADQEFAIKIVDKAVTSERPARPRKKLIIFASGSLALFFGVIWVVMRPVKPVVASMSE